MWEEAVGAFRRQHGRSRPGAVSAWSLTLLFLGICGFGGIAFTGSRSRGDIGPGGRPGGAPPRRALQTLEKRAPEGEWRLAIGHAMDVLRRDSELLFKPGIHAPDFSIYSDDVVAIDARMPSFKLRGLQTYRRFLMTLQWSVNTTCENSRFTILSIRPPVHQEMYIRWRLELWPKDLLATARHFLGGDVADRDEPVIVEGYSRYKFDAWSAAIVKHTIDITNPPMMVEDFLRQHAGQWAWTPAPSISTGGLRLPQIDRSAPSRSAAAGEAPPGKLNLAPAGPLQLVGSLPMPCEDDFQCNDGRANFPFQCCEVPIFGNFCCMPDDPEPGPQEPAFVPLPVPADPW